VATTQERLSGAKNSYSRLRWTPLSDTSRNWHMAPQRQAQTTRPRSTNLEQNKKTISFYMPNNISTWDVRSGSDNPTKPVPVNDVVNTVRKMECRKKGRPSCAKWDMQRDEYHKKMRILESKVGNFEIQGKVPTMFKFQFHIIARTDDITNLETGDILSHDKFGVFALQSKVSWSKNVMDEHSCPDQILSGAAVTYFCILHSACSCLLP
jgi:hypothetical protein